MKNPQKSASEMMWKQAKMLVLSKDAVGQTIQQYAKMINVSLDGKVKEGEVSQTVYEPESGDKVVEVKAILHAVGIPLHEDINDVEKMAKIVELVDYIQLHFIPFNAGEEELNYINRMLLEQLYLLGFQLTIVDLLLCYSLAPQLAKLEAYHGIMRWFDLVQHSIHFVLPITVIQKTISVPSNTKKDKVEGETKKGENKKGEGKKGESKKGESKNKKVKVQPAKQPEKSLIHRMNFRVGEIVDIKVHSETPNLYVEKISFGDGEERTVVSKLTQYLKEEELRGKRVICLCNLKPSKMVGVVSEAMLICANADDHKTVKILQPPEGSKVGDRVKFEGSEDEPDAVLNPKKKYFEKVKPLLKTDEKGEAYYQDEAQGKKVYFTVPGAGHCFSALTEAQLG